MRTKLYLLPQGCSILDLWARTTCYMNHLVDLPRGLNIWWQEGGDTATLLPNSWTSVEPHRLDTVVYTLEQACTEVQGPFLVLGKWESKGSNPSTQVPI